MLNSQEATRDLIGGTSAVEKMVVLLLLPGHGHGRIPPCYVTIIITIIIIINPIMIITIIMIMMINTTIISFDLWSWSHASADLREPPTARPGAARGGRAGARPPIMVCIYIYIYIYIYIFREREI